MTFAHSRFPGMKKQARECIPYVCISALNINVWYCWKFSYFSATLSHGHDMNPIISKACQAIFLIFSRNVYNRSLWQPSNICSAYLACCQFVHYLVKSPLSIIQGKSWNTICECLLHCILLLLEQDKSCYENTMKPVDGRAWHDCIILAATVSFYQC